MRFICLIIISWHSLVGFSQIQFEKIIHDFDLIRENGSPVSHKFNFSNNYDSKVQLLSVQPSCGCTLADFEDKDIAAKSFSSITLKYDPKGRPGYFLKAAEVKFLHLKDTITTTLALKGFAISDDSKLLAKSDYQSDYKIQIAPISHPIKYLDQWNVDHHPNYQTFIDDITYIIDQYGFVQLNLDLNLSNSSINKNQLVQPLKMLKNQIIEELIRRKYTKNSIGFKDSIYVQPTSLDKHPASISLYPAKFTNHGLQESMIIDQNLSSVDMKIAPSGVHLDMIHYVDFKEIQKAHKTEKFDAFIVKCVRNILSRKEVWLQISNYDEQIVDTKQIIKFQKKIIKALKEAGIYEDVIHFSNKPVNQLRLGIIRLSENLPDRERNEAEAIIDTLNLFEFSNNQNSGFLRDSNLVQNLPAYFQQLRQTVQRIDTTNQYFVSLMSKVISEIKSGQKIDFLIESSASKAPNNTKVDNYTVARIRGDESKKIIEDYLKNKGLLDEDISFLETVPLVSGPEYDVYKYLPQYYFYFQYLKLIPVYRNHRITQRITPYKINFNYNNLDVLKSSPIFQNFLNQLAQEIQTNGFVKLIIESSSSKVPTLKMSKNEHLSYHRAQEAKNRIYEGIQQRGFNPTKVIFMEERILVQGPEYKGDYQENADLYQQYQYIKILPFSEIKEK